MKILVCGGRGYGALDRLVVRAAQEADTQRAKRERMHLFAVLTAVHRAVRIDEIVHGAARGADYLAGRWARSNDVTETAFPVDHVKDGPWPSAGAFRNMRMYRESRPDLVLAFPGGRGTGHMVKHAREHKCPTYEVTL